MKKILLWALVLTCQLAAMDKHGHAKSMIKKEREQRAFERIQRAYRKSTSTITTF